MMNFDIPDNLAAYLEELDDFIEAEILPLQMQDDNNRFFDHRREHARTDWERDGLPSEEWEALLLEAKRRADAAGHLRFASPEEYGGRNGSNLEMVLEPCLPIQDLVSVDSPGFRVYTEDISVHGLVSE